MVKTKKSVRGKNRIATPKKRGNSRVSAKASNGEGGLTFKAVTIPPIQQGETTLVLIGDRPLMVNNKLNVAEQISEQYSGRGKSSHVKPVEIETDDSKYAKAFYEMPGSKYPAPHPKGKYGVPASGLKKCVCSAIRTTGITDNTTIGLIGKSFWVLADEAGFCQITYKKLVRDVRAVNIGSGVKTVPQMRHRPMFHGWQLKVRVKYNRRVLTPEQLVNLFMHAGQYIGLCEMRAEKKQGECGGFVVKGVK